MYHRKWKFLLTNDFLVSQTFCFVILSSRKWGRKSNTTSDLLVEIHSIFIFCLFQMDHQLSEGGRISPITLTSPTSSPYTARPHRRDRGYNDRYGSLDIRQSHEHKARDKFGSLDRTAAMSRYGYRDQRDRSVERTGLSGADYTGRSGSLQRNRSLDRDYPLVSMSMRSLADPAYEAGDMDIAATDFRFVSKSTHSVMCSTGN